MSGRWGWVQLTLPFDREGQEPVPLPEGVFHGSLNAYGHYKCRCVDCRAERSSYDRDIQEIRMRDPAKRLAKAEYDRNRRKR